ncbi:MAG: G8 domain-containing protein [Bacteroidota bacterium]
MKKQTFFKTLLFFLLGIVFTAHPAFGQFNTMTGSVSYQNIPQSDFEGTGAWQFVGSANTINYPNAPSGNKVLFLRGQGTAYQNIVVSQAGCFRFDIQAAQASTTGNNSFSIYIEGQEVVEVTPNSTAFNTVHSVAFTLDPGIYVLELKGLLSTPYAVLLDDIQLARLPCWSDASNWSLDSVPGPTDTAFVAMDKLVVLNDSAHCHSIRVMGKFLAANNVDLKLDANMFMVMQQNGLLEWGQAHTPYEIKGVFTLHGNIGLAQAGMQTAALMVMDKAKLQLHGKPRDSWTQLGAHANQGTNQITLKEPMDWKVGDLIVIASTDFNAHQAETRLISQVSGGGTTFHFNDTLKYNHFGELQHFPNSPIISVLDQRAEVGLLSRNLQIRGDEDSDVDKAGGHIMVMDSSFAQVSGVELFQMGQEGILGRYPFHWHLTGNLDGQYVKNSSIHVSYNRVLTVHSSSYGLIEDNVAYDHIGNGYFLENGDEVHNRFIHNLGILTRAAELDKQVRIYDRHPYLANPNPGQLHLPATFWMTHPKNDFIGNASAGSEGSGFWLVIQPEPIEESAVVLSLPPRVDTMGVFDNNTSHSNNFSNFAIDLKIEHVLPVDTHRIEDSGTYKPPFTPVINNFNSYKARDRAIWMRTESLDYDSCTSGDNGRSTFFSYHNVISNSLYVGKSDNIGTPSEWSASEKQAGRSLPDSTRAINSLGNQFRAHPLYDGPSGVENCHFANFDGSNASVFSPNTAATKSTVHFAQQLSFTNVPTANKFSHLFSKDKDFQWTTGIIDLDGTIDALSNPGDVIKPKIFSIANPDRRLYDEGFNIEVGATYVPEWEHYICHNEHYGLLLMENSWSASRKNVAYVMRSDGFATISEGQNGKNQIPVIVNNSNYRYYIQYHRMPNELEFRLRFLNENDLLTFVVLNVPSNAQIGKVGGTINSYSSLNAFENSPNDEGYFFDNNTLYVRLKGNMLHNEKQFGSEYPYRSTLKICQYTNCIPPIPNPTPGGTFGVPLADYGNGKDERAVLSTSGNLSLDSIEHQGGAEVFSILSDGDGLNEYVEYRLNFHRQVWSEFNNLAIEYSGPPIEVLLHDQSEGIVPLGVYQQSSCDGLDLTHLSKEAIDQIDALLIRVYESALGDLHQDGLADSLQIQKIFLDYSRDLWDFHRTKEDWNANNAATVEVVNEGILSFDKTASSGHMQNEQFNNKPPVNPGNNTSVILRMKKHSGEFENSIFYHYAWSHGWIPKPFALESSNDFEQYVIEPNWHPSLDIQRVRFDFQGATGSTDIDYIRFTDCPTCYNGLLDSLAGETDVDCGGPDCKACPCEDGIQNHDETGIDCGGSCQPCSQLVFEKGLLNNVSDSWITVNTNETYTDMVVIATPVLANANNNPVVSRIQNTGTNSFEIRLQNPSGGTVGNHKVHYFVVEAGVYTEAIDGIKMEARTFTSDTTAGWNNWQFENHVLSNNYAHPVILGQVQSYNDARWSVFWASDTAVRMDPPGRGNSFSAGKQVGQDTQNSRSDEVIGFIALEAGLYELDGLVMQADVGADKVKGVENAGFLLPSTYNLSPQLQVTGAVVASAAMDGNDGGWPILFGNNPFILNRLQLAIDEDQIVDAERTHTNEQVAFLAFGNHLKNPIPGIIQLPLRQASRDVSSTHLAPNPIEKGQEIVLYSPEAQALSNIRILTVDGRGAAIQSISTAGQTIHIQAELAAGMYFLSYTIGETQQLERFVIH